MTLYPKPSEGSGSALAGDGRRGERCAAPHRRAAPLTGVTELEPSCGLPPGPAFADLAVLAEQLGDARVWIFDSAPLWEDALAHHPRSKCVGEAIGPRRVVDWYSAYAQRGAAVVDAMPAGRDWREALEALAPPNERHLLAFGRPVTHLAERDRGLLEHIAARTLVGDSAHVRDRLARRAEKAVAEILYTPSGPDAPRELRAFASAHPKAR